MSEENNVRLYYNPNGDDITISKYNDFLRRKDKDAIADFIYNRLYSRYIKPFEFDDYMYKEMYKNGFSMMASFCLLIETLQSFKYGWGDSNRRSGQLFQDFFKDNSDFGDLKNRGSDIYKHIRCGILHQGESTGGWEISRKDKELLEDKTIDAVRFGKILEKSLLEYKTLLESEAWDSEIWDNFRTKMRRIIANTQE
ncbi:MAG: Unknown protein [uncultured Sulfurovum sp.]|uniref:Apea-like HEPN domain-containing protein n=1 Tax=uncultured Sulfurovum sp. TaxID=269237 RepID=A0A6S6TBG9_9BACT|nr:MAG: Unknown protein [uncultured Sulfurovum sp.]